MLAKPLDEIRIKVVARISALLMATERSAVFRNTKWAVAKAMLDEVADLGVSIAIANSGGLRASIEAGDVTMGDVLTVLPFQNTLSTFRVTGQTVIDALENGVSQIEEGKGRFPVFRFSFDMSMRQMRGVSPL